MNIVNCSVKGGRARFLFVVFFQCALGALLIDLYVPAMPLMVKDLHTSANMVQYTLVVYLLGYSLMQLIYGPLSDKHGRKPVIIYGVALAALGVVLACLPNPSIHQIILARFIQGLGMAATMSMARTMVVDCYRGSELAKIGSYMGLVIGLFPAIAPFMGGYITHFFGWQMNFIVILILILLLLCALVFLLPETNTNLKKKLTLLSDYKRLLKSPHFYRYCLTSGFAYSMIMIYVLLLPFVSHHVWGLSAKSYGNLALLISLSMVLGKLINVFFLKFLSVEKMFRLGLGVMLISALAMLFASHAGFSGIWVISALLIICLTGAGMVFPNVIAVIYEPFRDIKGSAGALYGCLQVLIAFFVQWIVSAIHLETITVMAVALLVVSVLANVLFYFFGVFTDKKQGCSFKA